MRYAMVGEVSGELLTWQGRVIVHDSRPEMEYLFPHGARVVEFPHDNGLPIIDLPQHPQLASIRFPLNRAQFVAS